MEPSLYTLCSYRRDLNKNDAHKRECDRNVEILGRGFESENTDKIREAEERLTVENGHAPTLKELAAATGYEEENILRALESSKAYGAYSLDSAFETEEESAALEKYIGFEDAGYQRIEIAEIVSKVLDSLSDTNRYIFRQRFLENRSQADIAKELGVSQMTVSRAEKNIIEKFKAEL